MKKEKDYKYELATRKYKRPNPVFYFIYWFACRFIITRPFHPEIKVIDKLSDCKGPAFLIWNHQSRRDHAMLVRAAWPRRINFLAEEASFFRSHLATVFKLNRIIPKKVLSNDLSSMRAIRDVIKQNGVVAFAPEGFATVFGDQQPIVPGTGRFLQVFGIPVYFASLQGGYLSTSKFSKEDRPGKFCTQIQLLFSPEDLRKMTPQQIEDKINSLLHHDDFKWNKEHHYRYVSKEGMCVNLADACYRCPRCGTEFEMTDGKDYIECKHCGNKATMDEYYEFHKASEDCVIPESPAEWVHLERQAIIDEIRKDPDYSFSVKVQLGYIPSDHLLTDERTTEICGEGIYTVDHKGVHYRGTRHGKEWSFDLDYNQIFTYPSSVMLDVVSTYVDNEYYDFRPEYRCAGKLTILTEEMHRYHINKWKNFPWFDYMYEGRECGVDLIESH
ncbi:MAG: 1-acyl-sn-glycerol-3-phosphate acyltransferase [Bacteroidales bacterium]|nr:1-acyl-sn-glycerol-3-phosphate acyltransferase [Bacteroidales bacterium]